MPRKSPGPSVKEKTVYERVRGEGASKEKAARIANSAAGQSRTKVGRRGGKAGSYDDMTKSQLYERAKKVGIDGRSSMSKPQLIKALRNH